jgi:hypothetical protein
MGEEGLETRKERQEMVIKKETTGKFGLIHDKLGNEFFKKLTLSTNC